MKEKFKIGNIIKIKKSEELTYDRICFNHKDSYIIIETSNNCMIKLQNIRTKEIFDNAWHFSRFYLDVFKIKETYEIY